jgi:poly(A) polymerase
MHRYTARAVLRPTPKGLPVPPVPATPDDLRAWLLAASERGVEVAVVGPAALALASGTPLPTGLPWTILASGPAQKCPETPQDWPMQLRTVETEPFAHALLQHLAAEPVRAWAVAVGAGGEIVDSTGGLADAAEGRLGLRSDLRKFVQGNPRHILDLAVWAAQSGLKPPIEAVRAAQRDAGNVLSLDRALWCERFGTVLLGEFAGTGLRFLHEAMVLQLMVPEVVAMIDFHKGCPVHHKDIWDHTLQVIEKCPYSPAVRWAALMHDTGKVWTRTVNKQGKVHFFRHEEMGASLMEGVAGRFHLDPELRDRVVYVIANHARANVYTTDWTDSAVRRLIRDMGPHLQDVIAFSQSDFTTKRAWRIAEVRSLAEELNARIPRIAEEDAKVPPLPKGLGHTVMQATGLGPGPWLGQVVAWLEAEVEAGRVEPLLSSEAYLEIVQRERAELLQVNPQDVRRRRPRAT